MSDIVISKFQEEVPILSLDSGVEEMFYNKCLSNKKWMHLLLEWANSKEIYIKHTNLIAGMYGNYSRHDSSHSVSILEGVLAIIGKERMDKLSVMDLWLLLHCAYAHDMGMPYSYKEALALWKSVPDNSEFSNFLKECEISDDEDARVAVDYIFQITNKIDSELTDNKNIENIIEEFSFDWVAKMNRYYMYLTSSYCRMNHASRTNKLIQDNIKQRKYVSSFTVEERFYKFVALCSEAHGKDFSAVLDLSVKEYAYSCNCHPAFIAALLRLGDLLDIDNNRFDMIQLDYYGDLERISQIHKKKHEAITHILYQKNKIEITAESDDEDVCRCANAWFKYLEKEVKDMIFNWADIAPSCLGGCQLSLPDTKVYLKGLLFSEKENHEFQINKNMLIDLVIGRNLYNSKLDFIREYIQNSYDALKMKFWIEINDESNSFFINKDYIENWEKSVNKQDINPFYFKPEAFDRLRTDIKLDWVEVDESPFVRITIADRGIGVDEECIQSISHIGSGWDKRKKYRGYLANMPEWLKPTGGFGIGMQSGFMVSDKVVISTKCEGETQGRKLILHSSAKSGRIEECSEKKTHKGTTISVEIPYEWFLDENNFYFYDLYKESTVNDYFSPDEIMSAIYGMILKYVKIIVGNSLFPIRVYRAGFIPEYVQNKVLADTKWYKDVNIDDLDYQVYKQKDVVYIWRQKDAVLCKIDSKVSFDDSELEWFYKGVRVFPDVQNFTTLVARCFGSVSIDIMGVNVKECLTVDRNKFASGYDYISLLYAMLKVYVNSMEQISELISVDITNSEADFKGLQKEDFYRLLLFYRFATKEDFRVSVLEFLQTIEESDERFVGARSLFIDVLKINDEKKCYVRTRMSLPYFCRLFWENNSQIHTAYFDSTIRLTEIDVPDFLMEKQISCLVDESVIYAIITVVCDNIKTKQKKSGIKFIFPDFVEVEDTEEVSDVFGTVIDFSGPQKVFRTNKYYPKLYVSEIPFHDKKQYYREPEMLEKRMIISPIKASLASEILIKKLRGVDDAEEKFIQLIIDDPSFSYLVDWVYNHQIVKKKYTKEEIRAEYRELIQFIYDYEVKKMIMK